MIADVVTGKLDVREAAAALPDESDLTVEKDMVGEDGKIHGNPEAPWEDDS